MPNLAYDPQNPADLLDRPITAGDIVAWGTNYGRSAAIAVCVIDKIVFTRKAPPGNWRVVNEKCDRWQAEDYYLRLKPLKSTGGVTYIHKPTGETHWSPRKGIPMDEYETKPVTVKLVRNVVKLDLTLEEVNALVAA